MKAKVGDSQVFAKESAKVPGKAPKTAAVSAPAKKTSVQPLGNFDAKSASRVTAKATPKAAPKSGHTATSLSTPKAGSKSTTTPLPRPHLKTAAAETAKVTKETKETKDTKTGAAKALVPKAIVKATLKSTLQKPVLKSAPKTANTIPGKADKPVGKKELKAKDKVVQATKVSFTPVTPKTKTHSAVQDVKVAPKAVAKPLAKAVSAPVTAPAVVSAATPVALVPTKAGRPSSRLAQLTVPSMAQSVASTAAKSSFTQTMALPLIVPPLPSAAKKDPKLANNWKTKPVEQLSDDELMAMPDAEYMNDKQLAVFRLKLSILKQDILNSAGETTEHLREDTVVVPDPADRATIEEEHALELRTRDRERKLLKKIEQSINRIDAGDYGYCDETGEPIGVGRLLARPTASLSLEAQQRRELKQKMFGD